MAFFFRKQQVPGLVGVGITDAGICLSHVISPEGQPPRIRVAEMITGEDEQSREKAFEELIEQHGLKGARCNFVFSPDDYSLVLVDAPEVKAEEMAAAIRWKVKDMIDLPAEEAALDFFSVPAEAYRNQGKMLYVVAVRKSRVIAARDFIQRSGLELVGIDIAELAMRNLSTLYADDSDGLAFVDLEPSGSTLNLSKSGEVFLTRHLNTHLGEGALSGSEWDQVKDRLVLEIQRSLDYFESQMGQNQIGRLLLAPRARDADTLIRELNESMSLRAELMDLNTVMEADNELPLALQQQCLLALGGALKPQGAIA